MSYKSTLQRGEGDNYYYNATIFNDTTVPKQATFREIRSDQLLNKSQNYYMSIIRFTIPNIAQPILYWPHTGSGIDLLVDNTKYILTIQYGGINYPTPAQGGIPISATNPLGGGTYLIFQQLTPNKVEILEDQFGIFHYDNMVEIINVGFKTCFDALILANPGLQVTLLFAPYMVYDKVNSSFNIVTSEGFVNSSETAQDAANPWSTNLFYNKGDIITFLGTTYMSLQENNKANPPNISPLFWSVTPAGYSPIIPQIFMNNALYTLFENFVIFAYGYVLDQANRLFIINTGINFSVLTRPASVNAWDFFSTYNLNQLVYFNGLIYISLAAGNTGHQPDTSPAFWAIKTIYGITIIGEWACLSNFQALRTIRIATSYMPISSEYISNIQSSNGSSNTQQNQNNRKLITDFEPLVSNTSSDPIRTYLQYQPTAEYRYINMIDDRELKVVDMQVFWVDKAQVERPFFISPGDSVSVKILFHQKLKL